MSSLLLPHFDIIAVTTLESNEDNGSGRDLATLLHARNQEGQRKLQGAAVEPPNVIRFRAPRLGFGSGYPLAFRYQSKLSDFETFVFDMQAYHHEVVRGFCFRSRSCSTTDARQREPYFNLSFFARSRQSTNLLTVTAVNPPPRAKSHGEPLLCGRQVVAASARV